MLLRRALAQYYLSIAMRFEDILFFTSDIFMLILIEAILLSDCCSWDALKCNLVELQIRKCYVYNV